MEATGLSGRQIENGKKMREVFGTVTEKAIEEEDNIEENNIEEDNQNDDKSEVDTDEGSDNEEIDIDDDNSPDDLEVQQKKKRALNGTGRRIAIINRYRHCFSSKSRKVRCDALTGVALYSAYRTYVPYSLSPFRILNPDTVTVVMSSPASHRYRCFLV